MPYYQWRGIELTGKIKKGVLFARTQEHLDQLLIKREIALVSCKPMQYWFKKPIRLADKLHIFTQLATLIDAGILVPESLDIVANQANHAGLQELMHEVSKRVAEGATLSNAVSSYPQFANPIMIQLIKAGEESGQLAQMLDALCTHLSMMQDFYQQVRSALLLPIITLLFFMGILIIIFVMIMPRFVEIFASMGQQIPPLTQWLLYISDFMRSPHMGLIGACIALGIAIAWRLTRYGAGRHMLDTIMIKMPIIGSILQQRFLSYSTQTLAVLLEGGVPLLEALNIVKSCVQNSQFKAQLTALAFDVESGSSLSDAMARHKEGIFSQDMVAMIEVAEVSGRLPFLLDRVGQAYQNKVRQRLAWFTLLLQPTIMVILGLLVALLIFAVYGPILSMSQGV